MRKTFLPAAMAAVALYPASAAAQYAVTGNNVYVVVGDKTAPTPAVKSCGCPVAECKCGPVCPCPVPAAMPADATVRVAYDLGGGTGSGGSGVVVWSEGGTSLVVTNKHVVANGLTGTVTLNKTGKTYPCRFLGWSDEGDVALLEVAAVLPAAKLAAADAPVGTVVTHHGNTTGPQRGKVTGYRTVGVPGLGWQGKDAQADYASESGDSGAGVFTDAGELVAIHWGGAADGTRVRSATPVGAVRSLLRRLAAPRFARLAVVVGAPTAVAPAPSPKAAPKAEPIPAADPLTFTLPAAGSACANGSCSAPPTYRRGVFRR